MLLCIVCSVVSVVGGWSSWSSSDGDRDSWSRNTRTSEACGNPHRLLCLGRAGSVKCLQIFWELLWKVCVCKYTQRSCGDFWAFIDDGSKGCWFLPASYSLKEVTEGGLWYLSFKCCTSVCSTCMHVTELFNQTLNSHFCFSIVENAFLEASSLF